MVPRSRYSHMLLLGRRKRALSKVLLDGRRQHALVQRPSPFETPPNLRARHIGRRRRGHDDSLFRIAPRAHAISRQHDQTEVARHAPVKAALFPVICAAHEVHSNISQALACNKLSLQRLAHDRKVGPKSVRTSGLPSPNAHPIAARGRAPAAFEPIMRRPVPASCRPRHLRPHVRLVRRR